MKFVKSPLNYTGNKYRILDQIYPHFPKNKTNMIDLFCGGATVGVNSDFHKITFIDHNPIVINLIRFLIKFDIENLISELSKLTDLYGLSNSYMNSYSIYKDDSNKSNPNNGLKKYNEKGYYALRKDYNSLENKLSDRANIMLYLLMLYAFNNDLRFNSKGHFNLPVGKTDLNMVNVNKLQAFKDKVAEKITNFVTGDFRDPELQKILFSADFIYMDPPYLITEAFYNKSSRWDEKTEIQFVNFLDVLIDHNIEFVLSNILSKGSLENHILFDWIKSKDDTIKVVDINYHYRSSSYNKKNRNLKEREVIVVYKND